MTSEHSTGQAEDATETAEPRQAMSQAQPTKKWRHKVSIYQDRDFTDRMRGAIIHTTSQEGASTLTDFINGAIEAEVVRLEAKYNSGEHSSRLAPKGCHRPGRWAGSSHE